MYLRTSIHFHPYPPLTLALELSYSGPHTFILTPTLTTRPPAHAHHGGSGICGGQQWHRVGCGGATFTIHGKLVRESMSVSVSVSVRVGGGLCVGVSLCVYVGSVAGINCVEWDAVQLPSQFMVNWLGSGWG